MFVSEIVLTYAFLAFSCGVYLYISSTVFMAPFLSNFLREHTCLFHGRTNCNCIVANGIYIIGTELHDYM